MSQSLTDFFGEELLENCVEKSVDESSTDVHRLNKISSQLLENKVIGLYFSAHWCPPCRRFTPKLAQFYESNKSKFENSFEIVFISFDEDEDGFNEYFKEMPWKALPFSDRDRSKSLSEKFDVQGIPSLVILSTSFDQITVDGVEQFNLNADKSFELWCQSKSLFWSKENVDNEHCWDDVVCDRCYLRPIIGKRYFHRDEDKKTNENLCQDCASSLGPLEEYLVPKKVYSIDQLLHSVPHLVKPNSEDQVSTDSLWKTDHPNIGFYFSAHWCPPCREFTPKLVEIYEKCSEELKNKFRLVFVSCDQDEQAFKEYHSTMNFLALPFQHSSIIKSYFQYQGIPSLMIISSDGTMITRQGRPQVTSKGLEAIETWARGEKLPKTPDDQFEWGSVTCDGCQMYPLIGNRYYCETCGNYDLCSECQSKGHEHPLKLVPPPNEDDE